MTIHQAYPFVRSVVQIFDKHTFPQETATSYGQDACRPEALKRYMMPSPKEDCPQLSDLPITCIARFSILNVQNWMYTTGLLGKKSQVLSSPCVNATARALLQRLKKKTDGAAAKTLWSFVFEEAYVKATIEQKQKMLQLASQVDPERMEATAWEVGAYRLTHLVGRIFHWELTKLVLAGFFFWKAFRWAKRGQQQLKIWELVRSVHDLIQASAPTIAKGLSRLAIAVDALYRNRFRIWLGHCLVRRLIGSRIRCVAQVTQWVDAALYFPARLPVRIARKVARVLYRTQTRISHSLIDVSDSALKEKLDLGGRKAHTVWMNLLPEAQRRGICLS